MYAPLELALLGIPPLTLRKQPRAMDRPVPQPTHATQPQRPRRPRMQQVVSDERDAHVLLGALLLAALGQVARRGGEGIVLSEV